MRPAVPAFGCQAALLRLAVDRDVGTRYVFEVQGTEVARQAVLTRGGQHLSGSGPQDAGQQPARMEDQAGSEPNVQVETKLRYLGLAERFLFPCCLCALPALPL